MLRMSYVLVVDDDPDAREVLTTIVEELGLKTRCADDGREALEVIREEVPQLVLLDLMMPGLDGFGVLSKLRGVPETRYIPVIVVTAYARQQIDMLMLPGVTDVIQKGMLSIDSISSLIMSTLHPNNGAAAKATKPTFARTMQKGDTQ
jgi:CheY-like chemotaxis protein